MPWEYKQSTGELKHNGKLIAKGYSGFGIGKNNFTMEHKKDKGPIPRGKYVIESPINSQHTGPYVLPLAPSGHNALGRTDFQIHGDSRQNPGNASNGCIIISPRSDREKIWRSNDRILNVVK